MDLILQDLNQAVGILGSMVLTKDGEYVTGRIGDQADQATSAALSANLIKECRRHLKILGKADFEQFIIESTAGKTVVYDAGPAYLFVVANQNLMLNMTILDIRSAAMRIAKDLS